MPNTKAQSTNAAASTSHSGNAMDTLSNVESRIYNLQKKIGRYLQAGNIEEVNRLRLQISQLQQKYGATKGRGREDNDQY